MEKESTKTPPRRFLRIFDRGIDVRPKSDTGDSRDCEDREDVYSRIRDAVLMLDFDGTLAPIVNDPQDAHLPPGKKEALRDLAHAFPVFIVSGRETGDVKERVAIEDIGYAGSHGFEIDFGDELFHPFNNTEYLEKLDSINQEIGKALSSVQGCIMEHKKWSLSIHYRCCEENDAEKVKSVVRQLVSDPKYASFVKQTFGKMVLEVRLRFDWDKGKAVEFIGERLMKMKHDGDSLPSTVGLGQQSSFPILLYIGDDTTDEDAFETVNRYNGFSILVVSSEEDPRIVKGSTHARYFVLGTEEVYTALEAIMNLSKA